MAPFGKPELLISPCPASKPEQQPKAQALAITQAHANSHCATMEDLAELRAMCEALRTECIKFFEVRCTTHEGHPPPMRERLLLRLRCTDCPLASCTASRIAACFAYRIALHPVGGKQDGGNESA